MTNSTPIKPLDLESGVLHPPSAVAKWKADNAVYYAAMRAIEQAKLKAVQDAEHERTRPLSSLTYWNQAQAREAEKKAKECATVKAEKAAALAEIDRLASSPDIAEIMARNESAFCRELAHWSARGYKWTDESLLFFGQGLFHAQLFKAEKQ